MRRGRELSKTIVLAVLILCTVVLAAALTGAAGMMAIVSVLASSLIFVFLPLFPRRTAPLAVRHVHRGRCTRAPPLF
jgi:hypothetical protein